MFTITYEFRDHSYFELTGQDVKYWVTGEGTVDYEGSLDGFAELFPKHTQELVNKGYLKVAK